MIVKKSRHGLRVATYNIHKCRGMDRRVRPDRIVSVLRDIDADIIALQEVLSVEGGSRDRDQYRFIADELGFHVALGENRLLKGGRYGNVMLSRFPIHTTQNYDITSDGREPRGCLRTDIEFQGSMLHVFNVHLGTAFTEHRRQAKRLFEDEIVNHRDLQGTRILMGDFNEWLRGSVTRTLKKHFEHADIRKHLHRSRTYPGVLPLFQLDHIYFDRTLQLEQLQLHKHRSTLLASDHLPLVADFRM